MVAISPKRRHCPESLSRNHILLRQIKQHVQAVLMCYVQILAWCLVHRWQWRVLLAGALSPRH